MPKKATNTFKKKETEKPKYKEFEKEDELRTFKDLKTIDWDKTKQIITLKDDATRKIIGILFLVFAIFTLGSFLSFALSWKHDIENITGNFSGDPYSSQDFQYQNWFGELGAKWAYFFMFKGFGIVSFWLPLFICYLGFYLSIGKTIFNINWVLKYVGIISIWFLIFFGALYDSTNKILGGGMGMLMFSGIRNTIGLFGSILFLIISLYIILWLVYNFDPLNLNKYLYQYFPKLKTNTLDVQESKTFSDTLFEQNKINVEDYQTDEELDKIDENIEFSIVDKTAHSKKTITKDLELELSITEQDENQELEQEPVIKKENTDIISDPAIEHYGIDTAYDPKLDLRDFIMPTLDLLFDYNIDKSKDVTIEELEKSKNMIVETLKNYNISISHIKATTGPTVTLFEIIPAPGVKISRIKNLEDDIALSLAALGIRIIAPIPGKGTIGIEVPNKNPKMVPMKSLLQSPKYAQSEMDLPICLGKTISNEVYVADLAKMPHLLMAGATGQGKSVGLNALLVSLLYKKHPAELKFVLVDPKKVELTLFKTIERHYLAKIPGDAEAIITDNKQVVYTLKSLCTEMDARYELLQKAMVRNLKEYNAKFISRKLNPQEGHRFLPYIVVIIDEVADLIMTAGKEVEGPIGRLAQLARAIGIHLVLATQRPSVNIITGTIKANFPARIAFRVTSKIDSRTILDANGADQLVGKGDMLFSNGNDIIRLQCPFVDTPEVEKITSFIGSQRAYPQAYQLPIVEEEDGEDISDISIDDWDSLFEDAARIVMNTQQGSTSLLQRKLKIGYNRAGRLIDQLEKANIVGKFKGSQAREVLIKDELSLEQILLETIKKIS